MDLTTASNLIWQKLTLWMHDLIRIIPNILLASVLLVAGLFLSKLIRRLSVKLISKFTDNDTLSNLFSSVIYISFLGISFFVVLSVLKLDKAVTSILAGAGLLGLALAFAFQDIAANFISGIFISFRRPFHIGDIVKLKDYMGKVEEINLRDTETLQTGFFLLQKSHCFIALFRGIDIAKGSWIKSVHD